MALIIKFIWVETSLLVSLPMLKGVGEFGYDRNHGKCSLIECSDWQEVCCSKGTNFLIKVILKGSTAYISPGAVINTIGVGLPFVIILVSYTLVFSVLHNQPDRSNEDVLQYKLSTIILTLCYFIFIVPIYIIEWIPFSAVDKVGKK